jgi:hypothetical protein
MSNDNDNDSHAFGPATAGRQGLRRVFSAPPLLQPWQVAVFVLVVWMLLRLIAATGDDASEDGLLLLSMWALGLAGVVFLPMWTEVVIDRATRRVHERVGWFRWATAKSSPFDNFEAVAVIRRTTRRDEVTGAPGTTFSTVRSWRETEYQLLLRRPQPFHQLSLPLPRGATREQIEALAAEVAAIGDWPVLGPDDPS